MIQLEDNNYLIMGMTFSNGISIYNQIGYKNLFEQIITVNTIEEDENLSEDEKVKLVDILNSGKYSPFQKRIMIMRTLDREKEFSSKIGLILKERPSKMEMVKKIMLVFRDHYTKNDILKKKFGEVLTSVETVRDMIKEIDEDFWKSPYNEDGSIKKVLETSNGSGVFLWMVIYKFMVGLESHFPDENERYKFIVENIVYACELQKSKMFNWLCIADIYDEFDLNVYCGSFLEEGFDNHMKDIWGLKPGDFSLVLSNPPYQLMDGGAGASAKPIYNLFTEKACKISKKVLFITPSRWFVGGKGLDSFRRFMMNSNKLKTITHFDDASRIFGKSVEIKGGVSYFLFDNDYKSDICIINKECVNLSKFDIVLKNSKSISLVNKLSIYDNISTISNSRSYFGISTNFSDVSDNKLDNNYSICYFSRLKGFKKWIDRKHLSNLNNDWRVCTPRAAGSTGSLNKFGNLFIIGPDEHLSDSYISFRVKDREEGESMVSYLKTNFVNLLLSLRKIDHTVKPDTCRWIPIVPFDREWTDEKLFEYFNLTEDEQKLILNK